MGRPRKDFHRLTRTITVRVEDEQYDWLVEQALDQHGDLSKSVREAIESARTLSRLLDSADPLARFEELLHRSEEQGAREEAGLED